MKKLQILTLSCLIYFWNIFAYPAAIIFDLGGVLIQKKGFSTAWNIGLRHFVGFYNPYKVEKKMFDFFNTLEDRRPETPWAYNQNVLLPQLLCDWLMGLKTNQEILTIIKQALQDKKYVFSKNKYHTLTKCISEFMFTPKRFASAMRPIKAGVELLKLCKQKGHQVYILSNWDAESFEYLCKEIWFSEILDICNGCVISGIVHLMKPDPCIFEYLFKTYNIDPDTTPTVYIDDNHENIIGVQTLKKKQLHCFVCKNKNFDFIKKEMQKLKLL